MPETVAISALLEKRARILGEIRSNQFQAMRLKMELASIDAVIRMFKPDQDLTVAPKVTFGKSPACLPKGAETRGAFTVLRETVEALSAEELAIAVLIRAKKEPDEISVSMLKKSIHLSFSCQKNPIFEYDRSTWRGKWRLKPWRLRINYPGLAAFYRDRRS